MIKIATVFLGTNDCPLLPTILIEKNAKFRWQDSKNKGVAFPSHVHKSLDFHPESLGLCGSHLFWLMLPNSNWGPASFHLPLGEILGLPGARVPALFLFPCALEVFGFSANPSLDCLPLPQQAPRAPPFSPSPVICSDHSVSLRLP